MTFKPIQIQIDAKADDADVIALVARLNELSTQLDGELAQSARDAAAALEDLAAKNQAARSFLDLKQKSVDAAKALTDAQAAAQAMAREIAQSGEPTRAQTAQLQRLRDAVREAKTEYQDSVRAVDQARDALDEFDLSAQGIAQSQAKIQTALAETREESSELADEIKARIGVERQAAKEAEEAARSRAEAEKRAAKDAETAARQRAEAEKLAAKEVEASAQQRAKAEKEAAQEAASLRAAIEAKTQAIKQSLQAEQSEIELQRQHLEASRAEQQARLQAAQAQGDEAEATRAGNALRKIESDQLALVARAKRAEAAAIDQAVQARRQELAAIGPLTQAQTQELRAAENHARALRVEAAAADQAAQRMRGFTAANKDAASSTDQVSSRVRNLSQLLGQMAVTLGAAFTFRELVTAAAQMEQLRTGLTAITQDSAKAGQEMEFLRGVANRIGADVLEVGRAYLGLTAATRGTAVEGKATREVFEAVATAMGKAGKSSAETQNALLALAQVAGKGVVQMEELRGQLGEALPGALQAAAKGMGITTADLIKLVESGQVAAEDLFPALTKGLNELYGSAPAAQTLSQEITNIKNAFTDLATNIGEAGGLDALKTGAEIAQTALVLLDGALVSTGQRIGVITAAIASMDFSGVKQAFADIEAQSEAKLLKAAQHNETLRSFIASVGDEALQTALAEQQRAAAEDQAAAASTRAGAAAQGAAGSYMQLALALAESAKQAAAEVILAEKQVAAIKARGEAAIAEAKLLGNESALRAAVAKAAADEASAMANLAAKRQAELKGLQDALKQKQAALSADGQISDARKKELQELQDLIAKKQLDVDKSRAQAAASEANARAQSIEVQNAESLRDMLQAQAIVRTADARASLSALQTQKQLASQTEQLALLMGDEAGARRAKIAQLEIEIKITRAKAEVARAEAEGSIAVAEATMTELRAKGELTAVKEAEINASIRNAQAKIQEANAIAQSTRVTEQQISNLRRYGSEAGRQISSSMGDATRSVEGLGDAARSTAGDFRTMGDAAEEAAAKADRYGRPGGRTAEDMHSRPEGGSVTGANSPTRASYDVQYESDLHARLAAAENNAKWFADAAQRGLVSAGAGESVRQALIAAREEARAAGLTYDVRTGKFSSAKGVGGRKETQTSDDTEDTRSSKSSKSRSGSTSSGMTHNVRIDLGGFTSTVKTDEQGADNIQQLLREIQRAGSVAARR